MASRIFFITGTDTGVGKTVFAALLTRHLRERGFRIAALKPICSGNRDDARLLHDAAGKVLPLDEVNPWHFRAPIAPVLAARMEKKRVRLREVVAHIRRVAKSFEVVVVEGAGGLLSPLGENFDSRDLIEALGATPVIVCPNKLGAVNQVRLVVGALPRAAGRKARIVLVNPARPDVASRTNLKLLKEFVDGVAFASCRGLVGSGDISSGILPEKVAQASSLHVRFTCDAAHEQTGCLCDYDLPVTSRFPPTQPIGGRCPSDQVRDRR